MNTHLPNFKDIQIDKIEQQLDAYLNDNRQTITTILNNQNYTWDNLMRPLENADDTLSQFWSPISHLHSVMNSEQLRQHYSACLLKLSDYHTEIGQNKTLFDAIASLKTPEIFNTLDLAQQKIINDALRDFHLSGVDLPDDKKKQYALLQKNLSQLCNQFEQNVMDATQAWTHLITEKSELAGLPEHALSLAKQAAEQKNKTGWLLTLEAPSFVPVMTYADSQDLRKKMYDAYVTRASESSKWDNTPVIIDILNNRLQLAQLLGFKSYADYSLATKMVKKTADVMAFLNKLAKACVEKAKEEFNELTEFAKKVDGVDKLSAWDVGYYSEKLRQQKYDISQETLRPYFPEDHVLSGLFTIVKRLYGIDIKERHNIDTWHKDVRFFDIYHADGHLQGQFYLDLYARNNKRGGAWMDDCRVRRKLDNGSIQTPIAYLTCNFNPPLGDEPAIFTHDDVLTIFHEFGHGLQHMLTQVDYADVSGINGVPWDAVELASQFMESWCWEKEGIALVSQHYKTGEPLPDDLFKKLKAAKNFQSAMQMARQLEFALFDFELHTDFDPTINNQVQKILNNVRTRVAVIPPIDYNRFQNSFSHIFAGGYAAGYYSYKWAEVLACDAFSKFEENGIFDAKTGQAFLNCILETGGVEEPDVLFERFRGRPPSIDALLKHNGINT